MNRERVNPKNMNIIYDRASKEITVACYVTKNSATPAYFQLHKGKKWGRKIKFIKGRLFTNQIEFYNKIKADLSKRVLDILKIKVVA